MKSVRAKFHVVTLTEVDGGSTVNLQAVYSGSEENEEFFRLTPSGQIHLSIVNPDTAAFFEVGKDVFVDFTKAEAAPVDQSETASE